MKESLMKLKSELKKKAMLGTLAVSMSATMMACKEENDALVFNDKSSSLDLISNYDENENHTQFILVDGNLIDFDYIGQNIYLKYFDCRRGGLHNGLNDDGYDDSKSVGNVIFAVKDGIPCLIDATDFSKIIVNDIVCLDGYAYLESYAPYDKTYNERALTNQFRGKGYVLLYTDSNGIKHMVDAGDMRVELASGFSSYETTKEYVTFYYPNGESCKVFNEDILNVNEVWNAQRQKKLLKEETSEDSEEE